MKKNNENKNTVQYDITKESILIVDPPTLEYPTYLIANFESMGYCIYKEIKDEKLETISQDILKYKIQKEKLIIKMEYPIEDEEYKIIVKSFILYKINVESSVKCIELINNFWFGSN